MKLSPPADMLIGMSDLTRILESAEAGDPQAASQILPLVYEDLRRLATHWIAHEDPGQTLSPTALVHEAYLRLLGPFRPRGGSSGGAAPREFAGRRQFFAATAQAMRRILIENARRKGRLKRGGARMRERFDLDALAADPHDDEVLALHEALERLAAHDPQKAKLVELRFFGGLTLAEVAECLEISPSSADRGWRYARAWLYAAMAEDKEKVREG
jgi:RNA polymerase sigma factor (TIGR02999 family)